MPKLSNTVSTSFQSVGLAAVAIPNVSITITIANSVYTPQTPIYIKHQNVEGIEIINPYAMQVTMEIVTSSTVGKVSIGKTAWADDIQQWGSGNIRSFNRINAYVDVSSTPAAVTRSVDIGVTGSGTVSWVSPTGSGSDSSFTIDSGEAATFTAYPQPGYRLARWVDVSLAGEPGIVGNGTPYTMSINSSIFIRAIFELADTFTITIEGDASGTVEYTYYESSLPVTGTITSPGNTITVDVGTIVELKAVTPTADSQFAGWAKTDAATASYIYNPISVGKGSYTVTFNSSSSSSNGYNVTVSAGAEGRADYSFVASGTTGYAEEDPIEIHVEYGDSIILEGTPVTGGYRFSEWTRTDVAGSFIHNPILVSDSGTYKVVFATAGGVYSVDVVLSGSVSGASVDYATTDSYSGSVTWPATVYVTDTYEVELTASPADKFIGWTVGPTKGSADPVLTVNNPNTYTATFDASAYLVTITVAGSGNVDY
jgi:hypothetical protein